MKSSMQGKGLAAHDPEPRPSVNMANLTRLSVLIAESDGERSREVIRLSRELGVERVMHVSTPLELLEALKKQAFDVLLCSDRLGEEEAVSVLRSVQKLAPATRAVLMRPNERAAEALPVDVEAIELPFSRLSLQGLLHGAAAPEGGLWCEVPALSLADILQMYHQARRSITVLLSGPIGGRIQLEDGEIVDAESNEERGMAALSRLLEAESGLLRTRAADPDQVHTVSGPFQSVLLEAAHRLDERRRDSVLNAETPSASSAILLPAGKPSLQAHAPNPESFLVPPGRRRRQTWIAVFSVLVSMAFAFGAALYLGKHLGSSRWAGTSGADPSAQEAARVEQAAQALAPPPSVTPPLPSPPTSPPALTVGPPGGSNPRPDPPSRSTTEIGSASTTGERRLDVPESFELHITSKPSRATVTEGSRMLGKTPLSITILQSSVARGTREFLVRSPGYLAGRVAQAGSASNVAAHVVLTARPEATDLPDSDSSSADGQTTESRGDPSRGKRNDLGIRLRR
jgi:hypothetical protein